jgi:hypothetical protein
MPGAKIPSPDTTATILTVLCAHCSPVNPYTNVFPLVIVLAVSLLKEALEDHKRHTKDVEVHAK